MLHEGPDGTCWIDQGLNITAHGHLFGRCKQGMDVGFTSNKGQRRRFAERCRVVVVLWLLLQKVDNALDRGGKVGRIGFVIHSLDGNLERVRHLPGTGMPLDIAKQFRATQDVLLGQGMLTEEQPEDVVRIRFPQEQRLGR